MAEGKHVVSLGTLGALLEKWLAYGKQGRAVTTVAGNRIKIDSNIRPALGAIPLDPVRASQFGFAAFRVLPRTAALSVSFGAPDVSPAAPKRARSCRGFLGTVVAGVHFPRLSFPSTKVP